MIVVIENVDKIEETDIAAVINWSDSNDSCLQLCPDSYLAKYTQTNKKEQPTQDHRATASSTATGPPRRSYRGNEEFKQNDYPRHPPVRHDNSKQESYRSPDHYSRNPHAYDPSIQHRPSHNIPVQVNTLDIMLTIQQSSPSSFSTPTVPPYSSPYGMCIV